LPQAVKIIVTLVVILLLGPFLAKQVANQASTVLEEFPFATR
jgi:type III secretion protein S